MSMTDKDGRTQEKVNTAETKTREAVAETEHAARDAASQAEAEARGQIDRAKETAEKQKNNLASTLKTIATELSSSASAVSDDDQWAKETLNRGARYTQSVASAIDSQSVDDVLSSTRSFARENPAAFLGASLVAGFLAGRAGRVAQSSIDRHRDNASSHTTPPQQNSDSTTTQPSTGAPHAQH